jgi:hypothetical protein
MVLLTANTVDQISLAALRLQGAVTVMVALLANESGAIQEVHPPPLSLSLYTGRV